MNYNGQKAFLILVTFFFILELILANKIMKFNNLLPITYYNSRKINNYVILKFLFKFLGISNFKNL